MAPLYLVSACSSAEEFVAAFRRYADRTGIFVPMAEPLPAGKTGRLALTLKDGGVMIEGEAQVITSSPKPQGLHGRAGMTVKFVEPDDLSKTVIGELEKARLAMKPAPPSVPPRPAQVPAEPRPVPPPVGGRIDASNALAECVAVGDVSALRDGDPANASGALPKAGPKFVVPAIPTVPGVGARGKSPTVPPEPTTKGEPPKPPEVAAKPPEVAAKPPEPAKPPEVAAKPPEPAKPKPPELPKKQARQTRIGMPVVDKLPVDKLTATPVIGAKPTALGMMPLKVTQTQPLPIAAALKEIASAPAADGAAVKRDEPRGRPAPARGKPPTTPPMPRNPTPVVPLPIARPPAAPAVAIDPNVEVSTESTDITTAPDAALDAPDTIEQAAVAAPEVAHEVPRTARSGGMRASEIMAAIPTDDWTMSPDASAPVVLPPSEKIAPAVVVEAKTPAKGPPTGDWTMAADPNAPDGWSAPAKLSPADAAASKPATGNPVLAVSSEKALPIQQWEDKPTGIGEPLVEIDSTLMEPLRAMPAEPAPAARVAPPGPVTSPEPLPAAPMPPPRAPTIPPPLAPMFSQTGQNAAIATPLGLATTLPPSAFGATGPQQAVRNPTGGQPAFAPDAGYPRMVSDGGTNFFRDSEQVGRYSDPAIEADQKRRKRVLIVAVGSAVAVVAIVVSIVVITGGKKSAASPAKGSAAVAKIDPGEPKGSASAPLPATGSAAVVTPGSAAGSQGSQQAVEPPPAPPKPDTGSDATVGPGTCNVEVTTSPAGAQIADEATTLGTTPTTLSLPCGVEAKLTIRKSGFFTNQKTIKPGTDNKLEVALVRAVFSVKVTSMPAGATITIAGKPAGVTPTTIKVPAFSASTITVTKDGYASDTQKIAPRSNNTAHHVTLKRLATGRRR